MFFSFRTHCTHDDGDDSDEAVVVVHNIHDDDVVHNKVLVHILVVRSTFLFIFNLSKLINIFLIQ